ncbi:MAG: hypothetical protein ACRDKI_07585 [Solirubrobacterales bacterium]
MRIKLIAVATAIAALAIGVSASNATLNSETSAKVSIKKAGAPATVKLVIDNTDNAVVPQRVSAVSITSKAAKWNSKAVPQCKSKVPTNADNDNNAGPITPACPKGSKVGSGKFKVNTGTVGQPIPSDLGTIDGTLNIYNYKPGGGQQAALLLEIMSDTPVPNAHQYSLAGVSKSGTIFATVPNTADLPPSVSALLLPRTTSLAHLETTIKSPKPKGKTKPFFTLKNLKNIDFSVVLQRDNG